MQHMVVVLVAQVVGDVGEGGTGCFGHSVVDDHQIVFRYQGRLRPLLNVPLLNLSYLMSGNGSFCNEREDKIQISAKLIQYSIIEKKPCHLPDS